jgi:GT2 family glycosyltransferase
MSSIGVAFITHCAKRHLASALPSILSSPLKPRLVVVNSSSNDGTVEEAERLGAETLVIPRSEFNHGTTRELARHYLGTKVVVMMTPDAYAVDNTLIEKLTAPIRNGEAAASYARQIPHDGADIFEAFPRHFNYPAQSHIRGIGDLERYGSYLFFCSDTCAAYLNSALDEVGGFQPVLTGEDSYAVAKLQMAGHRIAYVADAVVKHSHRYTLMQEFRRYFDTGLCRHEHRALLADVVGGDGKRGQRFAKEFFVYLARRAPYKLPYGLFQTAMKWAGYKLGALSVNAPLEWKRLFSSQDYYWASLREKTGHRNIGAPKPE